ncbi:Fe-S cluster assembly protein SufB [Treponema phagedenis]|uniref:Fe-S cluster assembly protein SufB n=1 Tax=Treponema phagedenis TaxID=162 RepID=UPI0001F6372C|nr:Fe-S cluster assembly protein SufB [Treponema phagedenis]EFW36980.1 FeS assembly protein SufB [Treponema phagedenis F0421]TYT78804.1 Fe-S cluster assembly protein SufB [Treponema phagedenis]
MNKENTKVTNDSVAANEAEDEALFQTRKKTYVSDIDRGIYDIKDTIDYAFSTGFGLNADVVKKISERKNEPKWMLDLRLQSLQYFIDTPVPNWGPDISDLNIEEIIHYIVSDSKPMADNWDDVPEDIKKTFDRLGIPEAERTSLAGVGAQYDSEVVYHSLKKDLENQGVVYLDMDTAVHEYEAIVKEHFMQLIKPNDHKFASLHGAVWSGGSFVYVPKGVKVDLPLQSYFRLNAKQSGQFEHTLIIVDEGAYLHFIEGCSAPKYYKNALHAGAVELYVKKGATLRYSTIENWSRNLYNLNTKRALVEEDGAVEWVSGSFGSRVTMLYPMSILKGDRARSEFTGVTFASAGQCLDTGTKTVHLGKNTVSEMHSRSISKNGGEANYRGLLYIGPNADGAKAVAECESLMLDNESRTDTIPFIDVHTDNVDIGHEAKIGRISDTMVFYLMQRGLDEATAKSLIIKGFVEPISKELPLEYAVELNNLITIELEGTIG